VGAALRRLEPIEFVIRDGADADVAFVKHAWAAEQRDAAPWCWQDGPQYTAQQDAKMVSALRECSLLVAQLPDDETARVGFILGAGAGATLDVSWIYVRDKFRHRGIARGLLRALAELVGVAPREILGRGWPYEGPALVATLRRHGLAFRWAP
jgi:ribosomal protein S18 acetylase RimI-like enzyme